MSGYTLALIGGLVYTSPNEPPLRDATVLILDGRIAAVGHGVRVPQGVRAINCAGLTVTSGFWNSHVHFMERKWAKAGEIPADELTRQLQDMLTRWGFTSAFDLSSPWENTRKLRERIESDEVAGPRILSTGLGLLPANSGLPGDAVMSIIGWMPAARTEIGDEAQASAAVKKLLADGVDGIKLFASSPSKASLSESVMRAAVEEAHGAKKPVFVHPDSAANVQAAVRAGVDVIAHTTPVSGPWDAALLAEMKQHGVALIPTLQVFQFNYRHDRRSTQDRLAEVSTGQLRAWIAQGGTVLFGTDLGYVDYDPRQECELMASAGMGFHEILASLTTAPAARFGGSGRIETGADGDVAVLGSDDVRGFTDIRYTIRRGRVIYSASAISGKAGGVR